MTDLLPAITTTQWVWLLASAFLIGMAKAGVKGLGMFVVPAMAAAFGGKASVGLVLPLLSMADVFAVSYYRRDAEWKYIWLLLPTAMLGVLVAIWVGQTVDDSFFTDMIAIIIILSLGLLILQQNTRFSDMMARHWWVGAIFGAVGGFTTMIGNAAGPVMAVYLLSTRIPKNSFIGTTAWFFLVINLFKVPFHIWVWETISWESFMLNLTGLPAIAIGIWVGIRVVKLIPEQAFRYFVIIMTALISLRLLLQ